MTGYDIRSTLQRFRELRFSGHPHYQACVEQDRLAYELEREIDRALQAQADIETRVRAKILKLQRAQKNLIAVGYRKSVYAIRCEIRDLREILGEGA